MGFFSSQVLSSFFILTHSIFRVCLYLFATLFHSFPLYHHLTLLPLPHFLHPITLPSPFLIIPSFPIHHIHIFFAVITSSSNTLPSPLHHLTISRPSSPRLSLQPQQHKGRPLEGYYGKLITL